MAGLDGDPGVSSTVLEIIYRCPRQRCAGFFIAGYRKRDYGGRVTQDKFELQWVAPEFPKELTLAPEVVEVSPTFKAVYTQAVAAETYRLDQIAGVGMRKALEFLVKDYCIQEAQADAEAIKAEFLGQTIAHRVADPNVKQCALRATWLGNDETHYERRWEGKDIADLKTLIELTMSWIRSSVLTKRYLSEMPEK